MEWMYEIKDVPGYDGKYRVDTLGRVLSLYKYGTTQRWLRLGFRRGYPSAVLCRNGERRNATVHRLVAEAFLGPCPIGHEVNHINGDKTNGNIENLEYVAHQKNIQHAADTGLKVASCDECHGMAKLTGDDIIFIRELSNAGWPQYAIGEVFGDYDRSNISRILAGKIWGHVV